MMNDKDNERKRERERVIHFTINQFTYTLCTIICSFTYVLYTRGGRVDVSLLVYGFGFGGIGGGISKPPNLSIINS